MKQNKTLSMLGLAKRAGKVVSGEFSVEKAVRSGKAYLVPKLVWQSGCKYLGYLLGKRYRKLPKNLVLWLTMNKRYWRE